MRRLTTAAIAILLLAFASGCRKPRRVRAGAADEAENAVRSVVSVADPRTSAQLVRGFHALESNSWRWTKGNFTVTLRPPLNADRDGAWLLLKFSMPEAVLNRVGPVRLTANVNGAPIEGETYSKDGDYTFRREAPASAFHGDNPVTIEFALDKFLAAGAVEGRELGIIVSMIGLEAK
ncbi:MAG: hypothetical protein LC126_13000 [Bryobacterales bacterium]|nr:hypothetical protein [Bryobacterales bacterium]